jgi:hypothetical protein
MPARIASFSSPLNLLGTPRGRPGPRLIPVSMAGALDLNLTVRHVDETADTQEASYAKCGM